MKHDPDNRLADRVHEIARWSLDNSVEASRASSRRLSGWLVLGNMGAVALLTTGFVQGRLSLEGVAEMAVLQFIWGAIVGFLAGSLEYLISIRIVMLNGLMLNNLIEMEAYNVDLDRAEALDDIQEVNEKIQATNLRIQSVGDSVSGWTRTFFPIVALYAVSGLLFVLGVFSMLAYARAL